MPGQLDISSTLPANRVLCKHLKSKVATRKACWVRERMDKCQGRGLEQQAVITTKLITRDRVTTMDRTVMRIKMRICSTTTMTLRILK
ncbi:MAG: hypothetical protein ACK56F_14805 [bacterium]